MSYSRAVKVEATLHGDRKIYSVSAFNRGIGSWLARLPTLWVEGEVTELRRQEGWQSVFFTLKDRSEESRQRFVDSCHKYLADIEGSTYFSLGTIAEDVEEPFGHDGDDLTLNRYCETIRQGVEQALGK